MNFLLIFQVFLKIQTNLIRKKPKKNRKFQIVSKQLKNCLSVLQILLLGKSSTQVFCDNFKSLRLFLIEQQQQNNKK